MSRRRSVLLAAVAAVGLIAPASWIRADSATWNATTGGLWSDTTKWNGGVPADGAGFTASFVANITSDQTVTLDQDRTIGGLTFTDATTASSNWILAPGSGPFKLTLDVSTGPAILNVTNQAATINAVLTTADTDVVQKNGGGILVLSQQNTFANGMVLNGGTTRISANSTVDGGGALVSGPLGTGTVTLNAGATLQDNNAARTLQNSLLIAGNSTISSSGTSNLTFNSAGLTTPATIGIGASGLTLTVNNTTTFSNQIVSTNGLTKAGSGRLVLNADNSSTWGGSAVLTVSGGTLQLNAANNAPQASGRTVVAAAGGTITPGGSLTVGDLLSRVSLSSGGVVAIGAATSQAIDLTGFTALRLGSTGAFTYSGTFTPNDPNVYRLGGGGGTLTFGPQITGAGVSVNIGNNGTASGAVILSNAANDFGGGIIIDSGQLHLDTADGTPGNASKLGLVPAASSPNITVQNGGLVRYTNAAASLDVNRGLVLGAGGGGIDTFGRSFTFTNAITGAGGFIKDGPGTLTLPSGLPGGGPHIVRGASTTVNSVLDLGGTDLTASSLVMTGTTSNNTNFSSLTNVDSLTVNGTVTLGTNSRAAITLNTGGELRFVGGSNTIDIGNRTQSVTQGGYLTTVDASAASLVEISGANVRLGHSTATNDGTQLGLLILPTAANTTSTINVNTGGTLLVGGSGNNGGITGRIRLGGGVTSIIAPTIQLNAEKTSGFISFNDGAATPTYISGGVLSLGGLSGGRVNITAGYNTSNNTGTASRSAIDTFGGSLTGPGGAAQIGTLTLGGYNRGGGAGGGVGIFLVDGADSAADINAVTLATIGGSGSLTAANTGGNLVVNNGAVRVNNHITNSQAGSSSRVWVFGGSLTMTAANRNIGQTNALLDVSIVGGTLVNADNISTTAATGFNHSGGVLARDVAGTTAIVGSNYNIGSVAPSVLLGAANGPTYGAPAVGGSTIRLDSSSGGGARAVTAPALARTAGGTLNIVPVAGSLGVNEKVTFTTDPATIATSVGGVSMVPAFVVAQVSAADPAGHFLTHSAAAGLTPITYSAATDVNTAGSTDVFNATSPQVLTGNRTVLALRAGATVDTGPFSLTVGSGTDPAGVILNGTSLAGVVNFGAREAVVYGGGNSAVSATFSGTGGLTIFGSGTVSVTSSSPGFSGNVRINGGTLAANNATGTAVGSGAATVGAGGTLGGGAPTSAGSFAGTSGFISGAVTVNRFGTIAPGNSIGTLTVGPTTLAGGSILDFEVGPVVTPRPGGSPSDVNVNDRLTITGALTLTDASNYNPILLLVDGGGASLTAGSTYDFFLTESTSVVGFNPSSFTLLPSNFDSGTINSFSLSQVGNNLVLTVTAVEVPEPTAMSLIAAAGLLLRRRRGSVRR